MTASKRWILLTLLAIYLAAVCAAVLMPQPVQDSLPLAGERPFSMGWLADATRNVVLFLPLGAAAFFITGSIVRSIALACALAIGIEFLQAGIPGRFSSALDVVSNSIGGGLGAWLALHRGGIRNPARPLAVWLSPICSVAAMLILLAEVRLLAPEVPDGTYFGGFTPDLGHLVPYQGRVVAAALDGVSIPAAGPAREGPALMRELREGTSLEIAMLAGPAPEALAPVVTIHDRDQREILLVGIDGDDLVVRRLLHAAAAGFENPSRRWRDVMRVGTRGEARGIEVRFDGADWRAAVDGGVSSARSWTPGRGWALVVPSIAITDMVARSLDGVWIAALTFPAAFYAGRRIHSYLSLAAMAAAIAGVSCFGSLAPPSTFEWIGFVGSLGMGMGLGSHRFIPRTSR